MLHHQQLLANNGFGCCAFKLQAVKMFITFDAALTVSEATIHACLVHVISASHYSEKVNGLYRQ